MSEKIIEIHGFASQTGGAIGTSQEFKYFELDIPELQFPSTNIIAVSLDIISSIVITRGVITTDAGKQATRRIGAVIIRTADKVIAVNKTIEGIVVDDPEMALAQTNLEIRGNKVFLAFSGTSYGTLFACAASVRYLSSGENNNQRKRKIVEDVGNATIEKLSNAPGGGGVTAHNDLTNRSDPDCHPGDAISFDESGTIFLSEDVQSLGEELSGIIGPIQNVVETVEDIIDATEEPTGFENRTTSTLTYDASTREFTITPTILGAGSTCYYWIKGVRHQLTAAVTSTAHADTSDTYFFYFDSSNVATASNSFWDLSETCPIAFVLYDTYPATAQGVLCDERHGAVMDWATHAHLHFSKGAFIQSGFGIGQYVLNSSTSDDKKFSIEDGYFCDEDIVLHHDDSKTMEVLPADRRYAMFYRVGVSGTWTWSKEEEFPLIWEETVTYNPYYNEFVSPIVGWDLTEITNNNRWYNIYTCATNSTDPDYKIINIIGQTAHISLAAAEEENILGLEWGDVPFQEVAPLYQTTLRRGPYGGAGNPNVRIEAVQKIIGVSITLSGLLASNHASLAGRDLPNSHPASAISYENTDILGNPQGDLFATDVQTAIEEISDIENRGPQTGTITRVDGEVTEVEYVREFGTTTVAITRVDGVVTEVETTYDNGVDTPIVRTKTLTYDVDGNLESWTVV